MQLLDCIIIETIKVERQKYQENDIITLPMDQIIYGSFKKNPMSWELIHRRLLNPYESVIKAMFRHQTLIGLIKHCPNNINEAPCTVYFIFKKEIFPIGATVDTTNLRSGELLHMDFVLYNVNSIHDLTSMLTMVCSKTIMLWIFSTTSKLSPVRFFILPNNIEERKPSIQMCES